MQEEGHNRRSTDHGYYVLKSIIRSSKKSIESTLIDLKVDLNRIEELKKSIETRIISIEVDLHTIDLVLSKRTNTSEEILK